MTAWRALPELLSIGRIYGLIGLNCHTQQGSFVGTILHSMWRESSQLFFHGTCEPLRHQIVDLITIRLQNFCPFHSVHDRCLDKVFINNKFSSSFRLFFTSSTIQTISSLPFILFSSTSLSHVKHIFVLITLSSWLIPWTSLRYVLYALDLIHVASSCDNLLGCCNCSTPYIQAICIYTSYSSQTYTQ